MRFVNAIFSLIGVLLILLLLVVSPATVIVPCWLHVVEAFSQKDYEWTAMNLLILAIPLLWFACGIWVLVKIAIFLRQRRHETLSRQNGLCRKCGYDLRASHDRCPECGDWQLGKKSRRATEL